MQCVILAGGLATRMRPLTEKIPKSLLPLGKSPFLKYQLSWLQRQDVTDVVMCIGHMGDMIRQYAGNGEAWNLRLNYVDEGSNLRGTAGALRLALNAGFLDPTFIVLYGDSYLPEDLRPVWTFFESRKEAALMTVLKNDNQWERSNAAFKDHRVTRYQKNTPDPLSLGLHYVDYGLSILRRNMLEKEVPDGVKLDLADVFHRLSLNGELAGYEMRERFFEIGSPTGLSDLENYLKLHHLLEV